MISRSTPTDAPIQSAASALYDVVEELTQRLQRHEAVDFEKVLAEHPEHAERLREILPALEILADLGSTSRADAMAISAPTFNRSSNEETPGTLGDFRILREIGRGGMGVVYEAEQISLGRRVALKVLPLAGMLDPRRLQRFKNEARAAAGLHHAGIVPVYAVGCERGVHYYAMQYIEGRTLAHAIADLQTSHDSPFGREAQRTAEKTIEDREGPGVRQPTVLEPLSSKSSASLSTDHPKRDGSRTVAEWGVQIAEALEYAHSVGVIHRDVKPANLILDGLGRVWITDFGLAQLETDAGLTMTGDVVGTLRYVSPEQAFGERGLVDQRSDVYSLGLTLYELLTLTPAFPQTDRRELLNRIANDDPSPVRRTAPSVPVELETIVHKAIEKEPAARYATARDLADDLRRFLSEMPIHARRATRTDRARKWARRNRGLVRIVTVFAAITVFAMAAAAVLVDRERQQARLERLMHAAEKERAETAQENLRVHQYVTHINLAERAWQLGQFDEARRFLSECIPVAGTADLRGFEWHFLWHETRDASPAIGNHQGQVYCAAASSDRRWLATGGEDGVRVWDLATGKQFVHLADYRSDVNGVAFSPDGRWLATASEDPDVRIWRTSDWQLERKTVYPSEVVAVAFSPDGQTLFVGERREVEPSGRVVDGSLVTLLDPSTWERRRVIRGHTAQLQSIAVSDDGLQLATGGDDRTICVWDLRTGELLHRMVNGNSIETADGVKCVAFAHRRPLLAAAGHSGLVRLWRTDNGAPVATVTIHPTEMDAVAFSSDDSYLAVGGRHERIHIWRVDSEGTLLRHLVVPATSQVWSTTFLDRETLIATLADGSIRRWSAAQPQGRHIVHSSASGTPDFAFVGNGRELIATSPIESRSLDGQWSCRTIRSRGPSIDSVTAAPDGNTVFVVIEGRVWRLRDFDRPHPDWSILIDSESGGEPIVSFNCYGRSRPISIRHPSDVTPIYYDAVSGSVVPSPIDAEKVPDRLVTAASGAISAVIRGSGRIEVASERGPLWVIDGRGPVWKSASISSDGSRMAVGQNDGTIHLWSIQNPNSELVFLADAKPPAILEFCADGRTLVGCTNDSRIRLWNVATGRELMTLDTGLHNVRKVAVSPGGNALAARGSGISGEHETLVWLADSIGEHSGRRSQDQQPVTGPSE